MLRCSWSIACRRCSNYIFILDLTPGFNGQDDNDCFFYVTLPKDTSAVLGCHAPVLRCSWSIACRGCSNYIFILDLTPGFNGQGDNDCFFYVTLPKDTSAILGCHAPVLRCSWSIACRRCSNYIFILDLTPGFNGQDDNDCFFYVTLPKDTSAVLGCHAPVLRCSWSIACRHCSNYIFILDLTPGFNGQDDNDCFFYVTLPKDTSSILGCHAPVLRCSWSIACRGCSNYIFILDLTPGFNGQGDNDCFFYVTLPKDISAVLGCHAHVLRCSWSIACRRCSNYIFILDLTPGFNGLHKDNCETRWETFNQVLGFAATYIRDFTVLPHCNPCQVRSTWSTDIDYELEGLTHRGRDKMDTISQTTLSSACLNSDWYFTEVCS